MTDDEREIGTAFEALRAVERRRVPDFNGTIQGRPGMPQSRRKLNWLILAGATVGLVVGFLLLDRAPLSNRDPERSDPSSSVLPDSLVSFLGFIPEPGLALPSSPLRALDPGASLGPLLERSSQR